MRTTKHSGRFKRSTAKHNDRRFDLDENPYIDQSRTDGNRYWTWCDGVNGSTSFEDAELKFYQENFKDLIEDRNERAVKQSHPERKTSASKLIHSMKTMPEEEIFEIGNKDDHVTPDELWDVFKDYFNWHNREFGNHIKILDVALHTDQATPNIHMRKVWMYDNEKGFKAIGQNKALQQLGYNGELPDPDQKIGRYNNFKMFYSEECRDQWICICRRHGINVERIPEKRSVNEQNLTRQQYIMWDRGKIIEEYEEKEKQLKEEVSESQDELEGVKSEKLTVEQGYNQVEQEVDDIIKSLMPKESAEEEIKLPLRDKIVNLDRHIHHDRREMKQLNEDLPGLRTEEKTLEGNIKTLKGDIKDLEQRKENLGTEIQGKLDKVESKASEQADKIIGEAYQVKYHTVRYPSIDAAYQVRMHGDTKEERDSICVVYPKYYNAELESMVDMRVWHDPGAPSDEEIVNVAKSIYGDDFRYGIEHCRRFNAFSEHDSFNLPKMSKELERDITYGYEEAVIIGNVPEDRVVVPKTVCKEIVGCLDRMPSIPASVKTFTEEFKASDPDRNRDNSWSEPGGHGAR